MLLDREIEATLRGLRSHIKDLFDDLRIRDKTQDDISGKDRLERVSAFSHRNFDNMFGPSDKLARRQIRRIIDFIDGSQDFSPTVRAGLRVTELDKRLSGLRSSDEWRNIVARLSVLLDSSWKPANINIGPKANSHVLGDSIKVANVSSLVRVGFDEKVILKSLWEIEDSLLPLPKDLPGNNIGSVEKWDKIMEECTSSIFVLLDNNKVCGYWIVVPIVDQIYERALSGYNINKDITINDVEEANLPGLYDMYFADLFILKEYRDALSSIKMLRSFVDFLLGLAKNDIFIRRVVTNISSLSAEKTCKKIGFSYITDHLEHLTTKLSDNGSLTPTRIYELALLSNKGARIFEYEKELSDIYEAERDRPYG